MMRASVILRVLSAESETTKDRQIFDRMVGLVEDKSENKDTELLKVINQIEALVSDETVLPRTGRGHASFNKQQKEERQRYEKLIRAVCKAYFVKLDEEIMPHKVVSPRCSTGATTGVMLQY